MAKQGYALAKQYLDPTTQKKLQDEIGEELGNAIAKYRAEIRDKKTVEDLDKFAGDMQQAAKAVLRKHLKIQDDGELDAIAQGIIDQTIRSHFNIAEGDTKTYMRQHGIDNYDQFLAGMIQNSQERARQTLYERAAMVADEHLKDSGRRGQFLDHAEKDFAPGYQWTDDARTAADANQVTAVIRDSLEGRLAPRHIDTNYMNVVQYDKAPAGYQPPAKKAKKAA